MKEKSYQLDIWLSERDMEQLKELKAWIDGFEASGKRVTGKWILNTLQDNLKEVKK